MRILYPEAQAFDHELAQRPNLILTRILYPEAQAFDHELAQRRNLTDYAHQSQHKPLTTNLTDLLLFDHE